jgi:hypothetical protein
MDQPSGRGPQPPGETTANAGEGFSRGDAAAPGRPTPDERDFSRRALLQILAAAPAAAALVWTDVEAVHAQQRTQQAQRKPAPFTPAFFNAHEYATVTLLAETIIPTDERSGGATAAGVPVFIDFMMVDQPTRQVAMRGGLAWLDQDMRRRFNKTFVAAAEHERAALLDDISGADPVPTGFTHGAAFFRSFRDLTATGFWTSKIGIADLQFLGNVVVARWDGCPPEALRKLGLAGE